MSTLFYHKDEMLEVSQIIDQVPKQSHFRMHTHSGAEIYRFLGGRGVFHVEGTEYILEQGDIMVFGPSESHYIELDASAPYERITVHLQPSLLEEIDPTGELLRPISNRRYGKGNLYKRTDFESGHCERCWQILLSHVGTPHTNVMAGFVGLLHELYGIYVRREKEAEGADTVEHQIIHYINKNLSQPITLDDICTKFYISKPQLCRRFKKATGTSVHHYITIKRLVEARNRLLTGHAPIQVGNDLGFSDYSSFYRAYRKYYGCSPGQIEKTPQHKD